MANLNAAARRGMGAKAFALPGKRFPLNDATHDRLAIGGATRSYNAGNISKGTEERVKAQARGKLGMGKSKRQSLYDGK
jgi:hypothetical protein